MYRKVILYTVMVIGLLLQAEPLFAQEKTNELTHRYTSHGLTMGIGYTNVLDSYLSPLEYTGTELHLQRETFRQTTKAKGKIYVQTLLNAYTSSSENQAGNSKMYVGMLNWDLTYYYKFKTGSKFRILAGPTLDLTGGAIYNERNSNNPAQAKVSAHVAATGMLLYDFPFLKRDFLVRYQATLPLLGAMFSPEYGESYYEIFELKHSGHHLCIISPFNAPSIRQTLTVDFPVKNTTLRIGYVGDIQQSRVNQIKSHIWSHTILFGFVKNFRLVKPCDSDYKNTPFQP